MLGNFKQKVSPQKKQCRFPMSARCQSLPTWMCYKGPVLTETLPGETAHIPTFTFPPPVQISLQRSLALAVTHLEADRASLNLRLKSNGTTGFTFPSLSRRRKRDILQSKEAREVSLMAPTILPYWGGSPLFSRVPSALRS